MSRDPAGRSAVGRVVGDVEAFVTDYWGVRPLLVRDAGTFHDLLDIAAVEALLSDLGRRPTFRVVKAGETIAPTEYTKRSRVGGVEIDDVADVDRVLALVAGGATVVLQALHRTWPPLAAFCADFARSASHHVQANAYLSPRRAAGLSPHRDLHDVVAIQVEGEKIWDVDGLGEVQLKAGDTLYVPARTRHAAWSADEHSLHLTIGIVATTRRQLVHRLVDELDIGLDTPLPFGYATDERPGVLEDDLAGLLGAVTDHLAKVDTDEVARQQISRQRKRRTPRIVGRLAAVVDPRFIDDDTVLRRRDGLEVTVGATQDDGDELTVEFDGRRLHVPAIAAAAMAVVIGRPRFTVSELTGLNPASRVVLARRLVREGLLEIVIAGSR